MKLETPIVSGVRLGEPRTHRNLTMFPLFGNGSGTPDYLTLDEALSAKSAHVTEVSAGGSVPNLKFVNDGDLAVLLLDGEELVGAKQNRVLNLSILAPAHQEILIPVSCVEQGRWSSRSQEFTSSPRAHHASGRRLKMESVSDSLASFGSRTSDQGALWEDISLKSERLAAPSPTMAMADIYQRHEGRISDYVDALRPENEQVGAIFAINGRAVGLDLFDYAATCRKLLTKLVHSYALDALDAEDSNAPTDARDAEALLQGVACARVEIFPAVGEGQDVRLFGPEIAGGALVARKRTVHLSAFRREGNGTDETPDTPSARMSRPSRRRTMW